MEYFFLINAYWVLRWMGAVTENPGSIPAVMSIMYKDGLVLNPWIN